MSKIIIRKNGRTVEHKVPKVKKHFDNTKILKYCDDSHYHVFRKK